MFLATSSETRRLDRVAIDDFAWPGLVLMENAARSIFAAALDFWPHWPPSPTVAILAGPGQNGGDGWVLARLFAAKGFRVRPYLVMEPGREVRGDAAVNLLVARNMGLEIHPITGPDSPMPPWPEIDLVVDALFGTGLDRPLEGPAKKVLAEAAAAKRGLGARLRVLAVDLPSGLSGDDGRLYGPPLAADLTVTLGAAKIGLFLNEGPSLAGRLALGDIGLTPQMVKAAEPLGRLSTPETLSPFRPPRPADGHKGTFGHVLVAGGGRGKTGALALAALGAMRSGAALVTAAHPASLAEIYETKLTEAMTVDLPEEEPGQPAAESGSLLLEYGRTRQSLAIGPGLGLGPGARQAVMTVAGAASRPPLVLDADALTHLAGNLEVLKGAQGGPAVLTPHPGEAARLLGVSVAEIQADRLKAVRRLADQSGAVVILKGHLSLIAEPGGRFFLNPTGGEHLAVGGSGDLLTGLTAGLLAQGMAPLPAAALAAWLHGRAADITRKQKGPLGLTPTEFAFNLPLAWKELERPAAIDNRPYQWLPVINEATCGGSHGGR